MRGMGHFQAPARLTGPTGRSEEAELSEGPPLLGAVALESLLLVVDPVGKRLVPTRGLALLS
jgi:hypothetical protein